MISKALSSTLLVLTMMTSSCECETTCGELRLAGQAIDWPTVTNTTCASSADSTRIKLYFESSGSMVGYGDEDVASSYFSSIREVVSNLNNSSQEVNLNIVNDGVFSAPCSYKTLCDKMLEGNAFEDEVLSSVGNKRHTDFQEIFRNILDNTSENEIAVLTTDLLYSEQANSQNSQRLLGTLETMITEEFENNPKQVELLMIRFTSKFNGRFFNCNSPYKSVKINKERPFFVLIFAGREKMSQVMECPDFQKFRNWESYKNYKNHHWFKPERSVPFEPLVNNAKNLQQFALVSATHGEDTNALPELMICSSCSPENSWELKVKVDLTSTNAPDSVVTNLKNWEIETESNVQIDSISTKELNKESSVTLFLKGNFGNGSDHLKINLYKNFPDWIHDQNSNDDSDINATSFSSTSFGLTAFCNGIWKSYNPIPTSAKHCSFSFHLKYEF